MTSTEEKPATARSDLDEVRALLERLIAEGHVEQAVALMIKLLSDLRDENVSLQQRLCEALRRLYGKRSEKLSPEDAALLGRLLGHDKTGTDAKGEAERVNKNETAVGGN